MRRLPPAARLTAKSPTVTAALILLLATASAWAGDWPCYRRDPARSAATDESLTFPLRLAWAYRSAQPPAPAWGEQLHLLNRVDFDYAPHPIVTGGLVIIASTADDTVRALDAASGAEKWHFTAGGPVRVPPQIDAGKVYFGADDGVAYCLDARDGRLQWSFRAAPTDERLVGNHRMISRWPIRSGVMVIDGMAYCVAGLWNNEGVYIYGLDAQTGREIWCNDTTGFGGMGMCDFIGMGVNGHHQGEFGMGGQSPQGPMAGDDRVIVIPTGFSGAFALDRRTGKSPTASAAKRNPAKDKEPGGGAAGTGGTWLTLDNGRLYSFAKHGQGGNILGIQDRDLETGKAGRGFMGPQFIPQLEIGPQLRPTDIHERGKVSAIVRQGRLYARKAMGIALADKALLLGDRDTIWAEHAGARETAELRFAVAGEDVAVYARVLDGAVKRGAAPWKGSCVEVFGAMPGKAPIGQVFLLPATATEPAQGLCTRDGKPAVAAEIRVACKLTGEGYELSALIPASLLALDPKAAEMRLEAQVTVPGADATLQRGTLYGSEQAYQDSSKFGTFKFKPIAALDSVEKVAGALKATKPVTIWLRGQAELWRAPVEGEAREIAVADGRVYVGTSTGMVYCFAPATAITGHAATHDPGAAIRAGAKPADAAKASSVEARVLAALRESRVEGGFALVLGDLDGRVSLALAERTRLRIVTALTDAKAVAALRERALTRTNAYGARLHVQQVDRLDRLPFAQFFANAVIVAGAVEGCSGAELYRVLHPCGGVLVLPAMAREAADALVRSSGATEPELRAAESGAVRIVRGKLPGALDWDSKGMTADERVKWPLRPLWFGGPSTTQVLNYRQGAAGPTLANGRYFIKSETALTAVDAYNGAILWTKPIPKQWIDIREADGVLHAVAEKIGYGKQDYGRVLYVNDDTVTLGLGVAYTRGKGMMRIQLDARTGEQLGVYGPCPVSTPIALDTPQSWPIEIDERHGGSVTLEKAGKGLALTLTTKDPKASPLDGWDLFFDFRPHERRYGLYERGAFHVHARVAGAGGAPPRMIRGTGAAHPDLEVTGQRDGEGTRTVVSLAWSEIEKIVGSRPDSFDFAATLCSHDGGREEPIVRRHLFGDWAADGINNGWAGVTLDAKPGTTTAPAVVPAIVGGAGRKPGPANTGPRTARELAKEVAHAPRLHPLTGEPEPKVFRPSTLCGPAFYSSQVMTGRAGIYDFADDSGMRFLGGVKSRCTTPQDIALGIVLISEETGHCSCNYPMRTTLALAPAERRLNEDWALFHDRDADTQLIRAALNLGAPGDRRDDKGTLWLGYPRPPADKALGYSLLAGTASYVSAKGIWPRFTSSALQVPIEVKSFDGPHAYRPEADTVTHYGWSSSWAANRLGSAFGPFRVNGDRLAIANTDRPWLYASGFRGIQSATLRLNVLQPVAAPACDAAPALNGKVEGPAWAGEPQITLPFTATRVHLRQDAANLYIAARRPAVVNRLGAVSPWTMTTTGEDAAVWSDDSFEVFLGERSDAATVATRGKVIHLGVSASGARFDALAGDDEDPSKGEDRAWNGEWKSAVAADDGGLGIEFMIPWKTIEAAGLKKDRLGINVQINQKDVTGEETKYPGNIGRSYTPPGTTAEALCNLGPVGRTRCTNFAPLGMATAAPMAARRFTVRLHFVELDDVAPGQRVFDVRIQGREALKSFDIVRQAGGRCVALVKEFPHVEAGDALSIEFSSAAEPLEARNAPMLSALEVFDEAAPRTSPMD